MPAWAALSLQVTCSAGAWCLQVCVTNDGNGKAGLDLGWEGDEAIQEVKTSSCRGVEFCCRSWEVLGVSWILSISPV